jgi:hypothetical protein
MNHCLEAASHAFFMTLLRFISISVFLLYNPRVYGQNPDFHNENTNLGVSWYVKDVQGKRHVYLEVKNYKFDSAKVKFTHDHWLTQRKVVFHPISQENSIVWRADLGVFHPDQNIEFVVNAKDELGMSKHWDSKDGKNYHLNLKDVTNTEFLRQKKPEQAVQTRILGADKKALSNANTIQLGATASNNQSIDRGIIYYTTNGWKNTEQLALRFSPEEKVWKAEIHSIPDQIVEYNTVLIGKNGTEYRDNNRGMNYRFKIGKDGFFPGEDTMERQKQTLKNLPIRKGNSLVQEYRKKHPLIVSLTSSPERLSKVRNVIDTLDLETIDEVVIALPMKYGRNQSEYKIPEDLKNHPKVKILRIEKDLGPITKLLPAIEYAKSLPNGDDAIVITVDDDTGYPKTMAQELALGVITKNNTVVSGSGQNVDFWGISNFGFPQTAENNFMRQHLKKDQYQYVDVVEGFAGIAYKPKYVDVDLMKYLTQRDKFKECFVSDDLVISFVLAYSGVNRIRVNNAYYSVEKTQQFPYGLGEDALHHGAGLDQGTPFTNPIDMNAEKYQKCYQMLVDATMDFEHLKMKSRNGVLTGDSTNNEGSNTSNSKDCLGAKIGLPLNPQVYHEVQKLQNAVTDETKLTD